MLSEVSLKTFGKGTQNHLNFTRSFFFVLLLFITGCASGDFSGASANSKKSDSGKSTGVKSDDQIENEVSDETPSGAKKPGSVSQEDDLLAKPTPTPTEPPFVDISTETGHVRCKDIEDAAATDEIGSMSDQRNGGRLGINTFVNDMCKIDSTNSWSSGAGVVGTPEVAEVICNLRGYLTVAESATQSFSSPGNNTIANWDGVAKKFSIINASQNNIWFGWIKCKGRLKKACYENIKPKCGG